MAESSILPLYPMPGEVTYFVPSQQLPAQVKEYSPAILVMTDLRQQVAITVDPNVSIEWALRRMKTAGVRLLFVVNAQKRVIGLITATDIQGEKPLRFRQESNLRFDEIMVRDIMTPHAQLQVMHMEDVMRAAVGDIVATLRSVGRHHALVLDDNPRSSRPAIRGIFSVSQISKQLDRLIETTEVAHTFSEVQLALQS